ncbi:MAG: hypothetical protein ACXVIO_12270 [Candidatus Angelobacter sp.]
MQLLRKIFAIVSMFSLVAVYAPGMVAQQATPATSEPSTPTPAAGQTALATPAKVTLKEGTDVNLKLAQALSSKTAATGDSVELVLDQDLIVENAVVAKKGSRAVATVSNAKKAGMAGKGGELNLRLEYLKAGDTRVKLRGVQAKNGDNKTGATVGLVVAFGVLGFMKHGKQAEVKEGTPVKAYIDEDVQVASLGPAPQPAPAAQSPAPEASNPAPASK